MEGASINCVKSDCLTSTLKEVLCNGDTLTERGTTLKVSMGEDGRKGHNKI